MPKHRFPVCKIRSTESYPFITRYYNGNVEYGDASAGPNTVTWEDNIYDTAPTRPIYTSVLRTAFQWKAKYGTPAGREQRLMSLERRATLAHNRELRSKYYSDLERYKNTVHHLGAYNPYSGVVALSTTPVFRLCSNTQTKHKVVHEGKYTLVTNDYYWSRDGWVMYTTMCGAFNLTPPYFYKDQNQLRDSFPGSFVDTVDPTLVTNEISKKILNDTSLMNIKGGAFSILTFFAELSDLKSLPALLSKWTRTSHDISDKFLGVSFGILPFYSDICAILDRLNNLPYAIDEWNRMADEAQCRSYHCKLNLNKVGATFDNNDKPIIRTAEAVVGDFNHKDIKLYSTITLTQSVSVKGHVYLMPRRIDEANISALKQHIWGTNSILGTVWEKIPFSFVVDWFLHLSTIIQKFEEVADLLSYRIVDSGYSVKISSKWTTAHGSTPGSDDLFKCESTNTRYTRTPILPSRFGLPIDEPYSITGLNVNQGLLSAALVHQQLKR